MLTKRVALLDPCCIEDLGARYARHPGPYAIGENDLDRIFPGIHRVKVHPALGHHIKGDADPANLRFLCKLTAYLQPRVLLEVGTFRGKTTYNFATHSPENGIVITIDLPRENALEDTLAGTDIKYLQSKDQIGAVYKGTAVERKVHQLFADSRSDECSRLLDETLQERMIQLALIDAAHDYESTKHNFEVLTLPRTEEGAVIVLDNYGDLRTHVGVSHFLQRKAHDEGYLFYWYCPSNEETTCVIFVNVRQAKGRDWRQSIIRPFQH